MMIKGCKSFADRPKSGRKTIMEAGESEVAFFLFLMLVVIWVLEIADLDVVIVEKEVAAKFEDFVCVIIIDDASSKSTASLVYTLSIFP